MNKEKFLKAVSKAEGIPYRWDIFYSRTINDYILFARPDTDADDHREYWVIVDGEDVIPAKLLGYTHGHNYWLELRPDNDLASKLARLAEEEKND